jgi:hypothetical protein
MKKFTIQLLFVGALLFGCEQPEKEILNPETSKQASMDQTTLSQAKLDLLARPDLRISKVVQLDRARHVPDGTSVPLVYVPIHVYVKNEGSAIAYASTKKPVTITYYQMPMAKPITAWINARLTSNLNPGETRVLYENAGVDARSLPSSKILQLGCFVDAGNRVDETNESNNREGLWSLNFEGI